jgi:hypothetical protein
VNNVLEAFAQLYVMHFYGFLLSQNELKARLVHAIPDFSDGQSNLIQFFRAYMGSEYRPIIKCVGAAPEQLCCDWCFQYSCVQGRSNKAFMHQMRAVFNGGTLSTATVA